MHYWAWGDQGALRVALAVAATPSPDIDATSIKAWTARELAAVPVYDRIRRDHFLAELDRVLS